MPTMIEEEVDHETLLDNFEIPSSNYSVTQCCGHVAAAVRSTRAAKLIDVAENGSVSIKPSELCRRGGESA